MKCDKPIQLLGRFQHFQLVSKLNRPNESKLFSGEKFHFVFCGRKKQFSRDDDDNGSRFEWKFRCSMTTSCVSVFVCIFHSVKFGVRWKILWWKLILFNLKDGTTDCLLPLAFRCAIVVELAQLFKRISEFSFSFIRTHKMRHAKRVILRLRALRVWVRRNRG